MRAAAMRSEACSRCGEEVRYGIRGTTTGWLHREDGDHVAVLGRIATDEDKARWQAELLVPRERMASRAADRCPTYQTLWPLEVYTTAEHDIMRDKEPERRRLRLIELHGQDPDYVEPIPEPEVRRHTVEVDSFPPRSGIRQMVNLVLKTDDWELRRLTHARGPYLGANGKALSISDTIVMSARGPGVDDGVSFVVCSWRDGAFDTGYTGVMKAGTINPMPATSTAIKAWIKENSP